MQHQADLGSEDAYHSPESCDDSNQIVCSGEDSTYDDSRFTDTKPCYSELSFPDRHSSSLEMYGGGSHFRSPIQNRRDRQQRFSCSSGGDGDWNFSADNIYCSEIGGSRGGGPHPLSLSSYSRIRSSSPPMLPMSSDGSRNDGRNEATSVRTLNSLDHFLSDSNPDKTLASLPLSSDGQQRNPRIDYPADSSYLSNFLTINQSELSDVSSQEVEDVQLYEDPSALFIYLSEAFKDLNTMLTRVCFFLLF